MAVRFTPPPEGQLLLIDALFNMMADYPRINERRLSLLQWLYAQVRDELANENTWATFALLWKETYS